MQPLAAREEGWRLEMQAQTSDPRRGRWAAAAAHVHEGEHVDDLPQHVVAPLVDARRTKVSVIWTCGRLCFLFLFTADRINTKLAHGTTQCAQG